MLRIGIAASKMAKGNLAAYNFFVVLISILCASLLFFACGFVIILVLLGLFVSLAVIKMCLGVLAGVVGALIAIALVKNIKIHGRS